MTEQTMVTPPSRRKRSALAESFFIKYGFKILLSVVIIFAFLTVVQCSIRKPESPTWTTTLTIPLVNRTYLMPEIIDKIDQPGIEINDSGEVFFSYSAEIDTITVDEDLTITDISATIDETLGAVTLNPGAPPPVTVSLGDVLTPIGSDIPAGSFDIANDLPPADGYNWATFASGELYIVVDNNLGVDLDTVIIDVIDLVYAGLINPTPLSIPSGIATGDKDSVLVDLAGKTISNSLRLQLHCYTPGGTVLILADKSMSSAVSFNPLTVTGAEAEIPKIVKELSSGVVINDGNTIVSAELASGEAALTIQNETRLDVDLVINLPDFNISGIALTRNIQVTGNDSERVVIDLTGYSFEPLDQGYPQQVVCSVVATIDSTAPSMVIIDQSDNIHFAADISNLAFASLTGVLEPTIATFDNIDLDLDLPKGFDSLQLVNAEMMLEIENTADLVGTLDLTITGNNGKNLHYVQAIPAGSIAEPSLTAIVDNDIADFLNPVPSLITVDGSASFGDGITLGTIHAEDYVAARVTISSPLELVLGTVTFDGDLSSEEIDQDDIDLITDHVVEARFITNIINHLPLGATVEVYLGGDSTTIYDNPDVVIGPISIDAGQVGIGGTVIAETSSENVSVLDSLEIKVLENDTLYSTQVITLMGSAGQPIKISGSDYIIAQGVIEVEYIFDGEF
ncbi:MAG: hypothetical protein JSV44_05305 [Candidatus Zixiibacteriota bacterium]|nr:MAG: hypothetical protein JSV44_05305 [candidate division Zixibacteria bacterium]